MTKIVNLKTDNYDVYIGRGSVWGNPYTVKQYGRNVAIKLYEQDLREVLNKNPKLISYLLKLDGKILGCYCKPLKCHGDVLIKLIEEYK